MIKLKFDATAEAMKTLKHLEKTPERFFKERKTANIAVGRMLQASTKNSLQARGGGDIYQRGTWKKGNGPRFHFASAPGETPAYEGDKKQSTLVRSIRFDAFFDEVQYGTTIEYGKHLENGTSRMAARPYLRPMVESKQAKSAEIYQKTVAKAL